MANFVAKLSIGFAGAEHTVEFEVDDEDLEGLTADQRDMYLYRQAEEVMDDQGYVEIWYEEID